jgi:Flp pilus assembly protein TadG
MNFRSSFVAWPARCLRVLFQPEKRQLPEREGAKRAFLRGEIGAQLVEMALALPILVGLMFGLMEVCLALYSRAYISELAREGSRYGALHGANCANSYSGGSCTVTAAQIGTYVTSLSLPNLGAGTVNVDTVAAHMFPDGDQVSPHRVKVKVTYVFPYKIPFVTSSNLTMSSTSVMTIIQ